MYAAFLCTFESVMQIRSGGYRVYFEDSDFSYFEEFMHENLFSSIFILCDKNTRRFCLPTFLEKNSSLAGARILTMPAGEQHKNLSTLSACWNFLMSNGADRGSLLICLGGGVVCDLGGFAASTFKRGISFVHVPTTLLAMADASVGGKTGIDFKGYKNSIGTITQPQGVFIYEDFLDTLSKRQIDNGLAEVVKAGLIGDAKLWKKFLKMKKLPSKDLGLLIRASVKVKNEIVLQDPNEKNLRKVLNFGHTAGHAIESYFLKKKKNLLHGEAIAMGMAVELCLGKQLKRTEPKVALQVFQFLKKHYTLKRFSKQEISTFVNLVKQDKKNQSGRMNFALIEKPGKALINIYASAEEIRNAFSLYNNLLS